MPQPIPSTTYASLCSLFISHLTVAIHTILAARSIYPPRTFLTTRAYNLPVKQSRHPRVCAWVNDAVKAVEAELLKGLVNRVVLVIFSTTASQNAENKKPAEANDGQPNSETVSDAPPGQNGNSVKTANSMPSTPKSRPLERYIWDVSRLPSIPKSEINTPFVREGEQPVFPEHVDEDDDPHQSPEDDLFPRQPNLEKAHVDMQQQFRGLLSRLSMASGELKAIPKGCTFSLCIELKDKVDPPIGHPQPWIPSEAGLERTVIHRHESKDENADMEKPEHGTRIREGAELMGTKTTPVRSIDAGEMLFEMWIEEGKAKFE